MKKSGELSYSYNINSLEKYDLIQKITGLVSALIAVYNIKTGTYIYVNDAVESILGIKKSSSQRWNRIYYISLYIRTIFHESFQITLKRLK